eukprot:702508-Rhodomonas_salina.5
MPVADVSTGYHHTPPPYRTSHSKGVARREAGNTPFPNPPPEKTLRQPQSFQQNLKPRKGVTAVTAVATARETASRVRARSVWVAVVGTLLGASGQISTGHRVASG